MAPVKFASHKRSPGVLGIRDHGDVGSVLSSLLEDSANLQLEVDEKLHQGAFARRATPNSIVTDNGNNVKTKQEDTRKLALAKGH